MQDRLSKRQSKQIPQNRIAQHNIEALSAGSSEGIQTGLIPIENQPLEGMRL